MKKVVMNDRSDARFYRFDPEIGFWGIPNVANEVSFEHRRDRYIPVTHNAEGNRDKPFPASNPKGAIVCLGGSHTWGASMEQDLRYTNRLEELTGRTVVNMGHCSLGLDQICLALMKRVPAYNPSIVVVEQYPWAIHRILNNYVNGYVRPYFYLTEDKQLKLNKVPRLARFKLFRNLIGSYYQYRKELREFKAGINLKEYDQSTDPIYLDWKAHYYDYMYDMTDKILGVMADFCRQSRIKLLFVLGAVVQKFGPKSPSPLVDYDLPRNKLAALLDKHRIPYVDASGDLLSNHSAEDPVIFPDGHINAKGHSIFAGTLHREMEKRNWLHS